MYDPECTYVKCPDCGTVSLLDDCDVFGADDGRVFCTHRGIYKNGLSWECGGVINVEKNLFEFPKSFNAVDSLPDQRNLFE